MCSKLIPILLIFFVAAFSSVTAQTKHALIFAIGNYPAAGGWPVISSNRDLVYIKSTLIRQGFQENNIQSVTDSNSTIKGITEGLEKLIHDVSPGDIVVIHFSSHGQQVEDDNNDEADGLDECIVTYNAVKPSRSTDFKKDLVEYFRDDQFGFYINRLRNKLGKNGDVVVFMDLCHSGTGTRGLAKIRGGQQPLVSPGFNRSKYSAKDTAGVFRENNAREADPQALATYVVISAAMAEELNYETIDDENKGIGSLTYAISKVFENLSPGTTYRSAFAKIQSVMHIKSPGQHPVLEGNGIDRTLFGGKFVRQKPYVEIEKISGKLMTIKSGKLSGLDEGAKLAIYPSGTIDPAEAVALATGTVTRAQSYTALVNLDRDPGIKQASSVWAFVTEPVYGMPPVNVRIVSDKMAGITNGFTDAEVTGIKEGLKQLPLVRFDGEPELIFVKGNQDDSIIIASNGFLFQTVKNLGTNIHQLKEEIQHYMQYKFLQGLEIQDQNTNVEVKLVPVIDGKADTAKENTKQIHGIYAFDEGDKFVLWLKNNGNEPVFINVLDIQPDGRINPVLPFKQKNIYPGDLKVNKGSSRLLDNIISIVPPYGTEILKIFVSKKEIDLEEIANTRGAGTRGNFTVLEKLVKRSYGVGTRGKETEHVSNTDGSTFNLLFEIRPAKL